MRKETFLNLKLDAIEQLSEDREKIRGQFLSPDEAKRYLVKFDEGVEKLRSMGVTLRLAKTIPNADLQ